MKSARVGRWAVPCGVFLAVLSGTGDGLARAAAPAAADGAFDAAPFGYPIREADGKGYGVRWAEPRKVRRFVVEFADGAAPPATGTVRVQYWHRHWDGQADPILAEVASGREGWVAMDDWTNGRWKDAETQVRAEGRRWTFTFAPTNAKEFKDIGERGVAYRKTLKMRIVSEEPLPRPARVQAFTDAACVPLTVRVLWGRPAEPAIRIDGDDEGRVEVFNGAVTGLRAIGGGAAVRGGAAWALAGGVEGGFEADLVTAVDPISNRYDRTIVTLRSKLRPFSFAADEAARGDRILVEDLGVLVVRGDDPITLEGYRQLRKEFPGRTIYDRVFEQREQTLGDAWDAMPLKRPLWFVHGLPANRNAMRQHPNGEIDVTSVGRWFQRPNAQSPKDSARKQWKGEYLSLRFGFPGDAQRAGRELLEGYLPLLRTWWVDGPIYYEQSTILDRLDGDLAGVRLDDPTVLLMKIRVHNLSEAASGTARLTITSRADGDEDITLEGDRVTAKADGPSRLRCLFRAGGGTAERGGKSIRWSLDLAPGQSHVVFVAIPSITLETAEETAALARRDFDADSRRVCAFWRRLCAEGAQIDTPEPWLNDFYRAHARHLQINCLGDLKTERRYAHVGTFHYGVYTNESAMMISDLDRRGYHEAAAQCLQTWLDFQGTVKLPGNFTSAAGTLYGANGSESGGYNKHHGYGMWCLAEHWRYTRDRSWMERAAPGLLQACEFIIRERKTTMTTNEDGTRAFEYGLLPAGGLEDVQDYWYWAATNACAMWGFDAVAECLADYGHPEAERIGREARAFHEDVARAFTESRIRAPVVRLRDGTYVPKHTSEAYARGRGIGWVREVLEGPIVHLLTGLVDPALPDARWILKDYEDNLYISERYGYSIAVFDQFWFSRGGFSMQANLLDSPIPYLQRDEVKHYLRTYFNAFASAFYPEIRMCNEHSLPELGYPAGDHFKSSDEAQSTYWLRLMFVREAGGDLYLGQAIPRYWLADGKSVGIERAATYFGPMSLRIVSQAARGEIRATVTPPSRNRPRTIYVRLRHPDEKPMRSVTVNGTPCDTFDAKKEWVVLPGTAEGVQEIVAKY